MPVNYVIIDNTGTKVNNVLKTDGDFKKMEQEMFTHLMSIPIDHPNGSVTISKFVENFLNKEMVALKFAKGIITSEKMVDNLVTSELFDENATAPKATYAYKSVDGKDLMQQFLELYTLLNFYYTKKEIEGFFEIIKTAENVEDRLIKATENVDTKAITFNNNFNTILSGQLPPDSVIKDSKFIEGIDSMKLFTEEDDILILDDGHA